MKETHLKLLGMSVVGISQISAIYPLTYSQQLYLLLFMRHIALAHQITSHCLWDLVISCEFLQTIYLLKFFSSPCGYLFNAFWISYEVLMMLVNFWSKFWWISYEFLLVSYEILMNLIEFLVDFFELLLNFCEFLLNFFWISLNFLWISYEFLTQFLRSSYAVLM